MPFCLPEIVQRSRTKATHRHAMPQSLRPRRCAMPCQHKQCLSLRPGSPLTLRTITQTPRVLRSATRTSQSRRCRPRQNSTPSAINSPRFFPLVTDRTHRAPVALDALTTRRISNSSLTATSPFDLHSALGAAQRRRVQCCARNRSPLVLAQRCARLRNGPRTGFLHSVPLTLLCHHAAVRGPRTSAHLPFHQTQANLRRRASEQPPRSPRPTFRALLVIALLANAPTSASLIHDKPVVHQLASRALVQPQRKTIPHRSNFSLAAVLLEISACVALSKG
eukprot:6210250-Pleurochrysis_carterae.AAC.2